TILARFQDQNRITPGLAREVALAADKGIVLGTTDKRFDPFGTATREQAAAMLARMYRQLP
ncbi:MAG: S-layer homology domain-containing protein, partial [Clostridia bacterium]|nr:S-layer homology domain-containing protein [Clostridia bacterium]